MDVRLNVTCRDDIALAPALLEGDDFAPLFGGEAFDAADEAAGHGSRPLRAGKALSGMVAQQRRPVVLQPRLEDVRLHPADRLDLQEHVIPDDIGDRFR